MFRVWTTFSVPKVAPTRRPAGPSILASVLGALGSVIISTVSVTSTTGPEDLGTSRLFQGFQKVEIFSWDPHTKKRRVLGQVGLRNKWP